MCIAPGKRGWVGAVAGGLTGATSMTQREGVKGWAAEPRTLGPRYSHNRENRNTPPWEGGGGSRAEGLTWPVEHRGRAGGMGRGMDPRALDIFISHSHSQWNIHQAKWIKMLI